MLYLICNKKVNIYGVHEEEVYSAWNKAVRGEEFGKIEPLK